MRSILLLSTVALILLLVSTAHGQKQKAPKPQEEKIELKGFLTDGGMTNIVEGGALYLHDEDASQVVVPCLLHGGEHGGPGVHSE